MKTLSISPRLNRLHALFAALALGMLAGPAAAHHAGPRYATAVPHYHYAASVYGRVYGPGHVYRPLTLRQKRIHRAAWARQLAWHDRHWGKHCRHRHRPHEHVSIGGRIVIRF